MADPHEAWVIETSGHRWAARVIRSGTYAISNQPTIRTEWDQASQDLIDYAIAAGWWPASENRPFDFARAYTDPGTPLQVSHLRLQRSRHLLTEAARDGKIAFDQATRVLRDHYEDTFLGGPYFTAALPDLMTMSPECEGWSAIGDSGDPLSLDVDMRAVVAIRFGPADRLTSDGRDFAHTEDPVT